MNCQNKDQSFDLKKIRVTAATGQRGQKAFIIRKKISTLNCQNKDQSFDFKKIRVTATTGHIKQKTFIRTKKY
ncbi:hypothetical protein [Chryseobacterium profundimaris]|uniref:hypothetical protein n=1 Tax=Chryseobacterium profundimaris TaxID=1387275 RepID=UPI0024B87707|nr:hypothetical protein [Chryseobacterium profundimaris]